MEISDIIFLKEENERVCNICQWDYIDLMIKYGQKKNMNYGK
jgi:hypothetical protein